MALFVPGLVRHARRLADLSQRELAQRSGVAASAICRIEAGREQPRLVTVERLLACAGVTLQVVVPDESPATGRETRGAPHEAPVPQPETPVNRSADPADSDRRRDDPSYQPPRDWDDSDAARDAAGRHFPAHLDARCPSYERPWWYFFRDTCGLPPPLLTFDLSRFQRDAYRQADRRSAHDPDDRREYPFGRSRVVIPGYRPKPRYDAGDDFW